MKTLDRFDRCWIAAMLTLTACALLGLSGCAGTEPIDVAEGGYEDPDAEALEECVGLSNTRVTGRVFQRWAELRCDRRLAGDL